MNIFYLHNDQRECAMLHTDKHVVKMILEYAQLLSTAHRYLDGTETKELSASGRRITRWKLESNLDSVLYKATHANHPSAVWTRQSDANYMWLANMLVALCEEYTYRYGKTHKVERDGLCFVLRDNIPKRIPKGQFTEPTPAMPDQYKVSGNSVRSYINYYVGAKQHLASWKKRQKPVWY